MRELINVDCSKKSVCEVVSTYVRASMRNARLESQKEFVVTIFRKTGETGVKVKLASPN